MASGSNLMSLFLGIDEDTVTTECPSEPTRHLKVMRLLLKWTKEIGDLPGIPVAFIEFPSSSPSSLDWL